MSPWNRTRSLAWRDGPKVMTESDRGVFYYIAVAGDYILPLVLVYILLLVPCGNNIYITTSRQPLPAPKLSVQYPVLLSPVHLRSQIRSRAEAVSNLILEFLVFPWGISSFKVSCFALHRILGSMGISPLKGVAYSCYHLRYWSNTPESQYAFERSSL
jgi:hypothetical protein